MNKPFLLYRTHFFRDLIISILILSSPFLFFLYDLSPEEMYKWKVFFITIDTKGSGYEINGALWLISYKLLTISLLSIWLLTCQHKWRYVIIIILVAELNKITGFFIQLNNRPTEYVFFYSIIVSFIIISLILTLSTRLNYYYLFKKIDRQLNEEINSHILLSFNFKEIDYKELKKQLKKLRVEKSSYNKKEYLTKLIKLREDYLT